MSVFLKRFFAGAVLCAFFILAETPALAERRGAAEGLFGHREIVSKGTAAFTKWNKASRVTTTAAPQEWNDFVAAQRSHSPQRQLEAVNDYMNSIPYKSDDENYGKGDHWASLPEFMARGGDCEDYALAKYRTLLALGFSAESMRLVILYDESKDIDHAVLAVAIDGAWHILDNQISTVQRDDELPNYRPIYAISKNTWWRFI